LLQAIPVPALTMGRPKQAQCSMDLSCIVRHLNGFTEGDARSVPLRSSRFAVSLLVLYWW